MLKYVGEWDVKTVRKSGFKSPSRNGLNEEATNGMVQ